MSRWLDRDHDGKVYRVLILTADNEIVGALGPYSSLGVARGQVTRERRYRPVWRQYTWVVEEATRWIAVESLTPLDGIETN